MSLVNVESANGYLEAIGEDGVAIATLTQDVEDTDFVSIKNISMDISFGNISTISSTAKRLWPSTALASNVSSEVTITSSNNSTSVYRIFDDLQANSTHKWYAGSSLLTSPYWIKFQLPESKKFTSYKFRTVEDTYSPNNWTIEASNDNVNWDILDTRTNQVLAPLADTPEYTINIPGDYLYYRMVVNSTIGNTDNFGMMELWIYYKTYNSTPVDLMTSDTTPAPYTVSGYTLYTGIPAWYGYDGSDATRIILGSTVGYSIIDFGYPKIIKSFDMTSGTHSQPGQTPDTLTLYGSNDNTNWTIVMPETATLTWGAPETKNFTVTSPGSYRYYKMVPYNSGNVYVGWSQLQYYEEDIKTRSNVLNSNVLLEDGDNLVIIKTDNTYHSLVASGVIESSPGHYEVDTTSVTNGEEPIRAYKLKDSLEFNNNLLQNPVDSFSVATNLFSTRTYDDIFLTPTRTIETKVNLNNKNKVTAISMDLWKS